MSPEKEISITNIFKIASMNPEQFNYGCDSLVDYQVPPSTHDTLCQVLEQGRNVVLLTNHQSYFEIETQRKFSKNLKDSLGKHFQSLLLYSAPAVEHNIGSYLKLRNPIYQLSGLNLLGIIRNDDNHHPVYKESITKEMETTSRENIRFYNRKLDEGGNLFIFPYESSLEGGRIDPQTQKIKGLQIAKPNCLDIFIKRNILILPCGIDGSYRLIDPKTHQPSRQLAESIINGKSSQKLVTFKTGQFIDPKSQTELGFSYQDISQQAIVEIARLVSPQARGVYSKHV